MKAETPANRFGNVKAPVAVEGLAGIALASACEPEDTVPEGVVVGEPG